MLPAGLPRAQPGGGPVRLTAARTTLPDMPTAALFNGACPGPLLRVTSGGALEATLVNRLDTPLNLRLHGLRAPPPGLTAPAGGEMPLALRPAEPGLIFYRASRLWTPDDPARRLYGALIVDEPVPAGFDAEILAILDDWPAAGAGLRGVPPVRFTLNGAAIPQAGVHRPGARIRLRLLNASPDKIMVVGFEGARAQVAAIDGQPCELFDPVRASIPMGPGARFDVALELDGEPGKSAAIVLRGPRPPGREPEADQPLLTIRTEGAPMETRAPLASLPLNPALPAAIPLQNARRFDLTLEGGPDWPEGMGAAVAMGFAPGDTPPAAPWRALWTSGGKPAGVDPARPLFQVKRGTPVSLGFLNRTAVPLPVHVEGQAMRQLHLLDDGWEPYWRDTVLVPDRRTVRVAFVPDRPGRFAIECPALIGAQKPVSAFFEVT